MLLYLGAPQSTARYTIQTPIIYWTLVFGGRDRGPKAIIMWIEVPGPHPTPWCQQEPDSQKPQAVCRCGSWGTLRESHPWNTLRVATWKPAAQPHTAKSASCEATQLYKTVRVRVGCSCFAQKKHPHCRATPRSSEHFNTGIPGYPKGCFLQMMDHLQGIENFVDVILVIWYYVCIWWHIYLYIPGCSQN